MNIPQLKIIFLKDWKELLKSKQALIPMIILPAIFVIVLPSIIILTTSTGAASIMMSGGVDSFLKKFPDTLTPEGLDRTQKFLYATLVYFFGPFFLLIPIMFSSIIASYSFAGEKEKKTIEGLLYTPISDKTLVLGKILVALVPAQIIAILCFLIYAILVNSLAYPVFHRVFFPNISWILMIFWLTPAISFISLALIVAVSQRAAGVWEAQQISVLLILPVIGLVISQATGLFYLSALLILLVGAILFIIDYIFYQWINKTFDRERIVTRLT